MILDSHTLQPVHFPTLSIFVHQDIPCPRLSNPMFERHRRPRDPKGRWWSGMAGHIISRRTVILRRQARQAPHPPFRNLLFQSYHHLPQTALGRRQHRLVSRVSHRIRHRLHLGSCIVLPDLNRRCPWTRVDLDCSLSPCLRRRKSNMVSPWSWLYYTWVLIITCRNQRLGKSVLVAVTCQCLGAKHPNTSTSAYPSPIRSFYCPPIYTPIAWTNRVMQFDAVSRLQRQEACSDV